MNHPTMVGFLAFVGIVKYKIKSCFNVAGSSLIELFRREMQEQEKLLLGAWHKCFKRPKI